MLETFKNMVLPTKNKLFRFALRILESHEEAEDVVQDVMIKMWDKRADLSKYQNIEAWCMRLTKNLSLDKLKSKHRQTHIQQVEIDVASFSLNPDKELELNDTCSHIEKMMNELPEKQKMVMQLRDIEGYSYQEIADVMEISMSQVKVNLFRARDKVRQQLTKTNNYGIQQ
jgi:RNA polymerase sigma-70 factor (ECF subfamily)